MHTGRRTIMLRILFLAGLTSLWLAALASSAQAGGRSGTSSRSSKTETAHAGTATEPDTERPGRRPLATVKKKAAQVVSPAARNARRTARSAQAVLANQGLLRQSWTIADLNPMPALLDLDDTARSLRRATEEIARLMTR